MWDYLIIFNPKSKYPKYPFLFLYCCELGDRAVAQGRTKGGGSSSSLAVAEKGWEYLEMGKRGIRERGWRWRRRNLWRRRRRFIWTVDGRGGRADVTAGDALAAIVVVRQASSPENLERGRRESKRVLCVEGETNQRKKWRTWWCSTVAADNGNLA